jgi:hypothetical protein
MACDCGGVISDTLIPCPTEGWIFRDQDREAFSNAACRDIVSFFAAVRDGGRAEWIAAYFTPQYPTDVSDEGIASDILSVHAGRFHLSVAECAQCGRLWVQREPGVNSYWSWSPDEPGYAGALRSGMVLKLHYVEAAPTWGARPQAAAMIRFS